MNANKTEHMCFRQNISTRGNSLELVEQWTHFCSNISSTENDINICLAKVWTGIDKLLSIRKSDLSQK